MLPAVTRHWDFRIREISPRHLFFFFLFLLLKLYLYFTVEKNAQSPPACIQPWNSSRNSILSLIHLSVLSCHLCFKSYVNILPQKECHCFISKGYIVYNELNAIAHHKTVILCIKRNTFPFTDDCLFSWDDLYIIISFKEREK